MAASASPSAGQPGHTGRPAGSGRPGGSRAAGKPGRSGPPGFRVRRVYEEPEPADGVRVLVDRLWPRGLSKDHAAVDAWPKDLTPSGELRSWYHAHPDEYPEFARRYRAELAEPELDEPLGRLRDLGAKGPVTLLTAVKDPERGHVPVLRAYLEDEDAGES